MTKFTFSEPIEVPGAILPAGTYWFVLADNTSDRNIVQIFSSDWSHLCAIIMTITTYRQNPSGDTEVKFAERPHYEPQALVKWYYPGLLNEHEFLYPRREERELAHDVKLDIIPKG